MIIASSVGDVDAIPYLLKKVMKVLAYGMMSWILSSHRKSKALMNNKVINYFNFCPFELVKIGK